MAIITLQDAIEHQFQAEISWKNRILGAYSTIGAKGCALTSCSMLCNYLIRNFRDSSGNRYGTNPAWLDEWFDLYSRDKETGYVPGTDLLIWNSIVPYLKSCNVIFDSTADSYNIVEFPGIVKSNIDKDIPVIGGISYGSPKLKPDHYVLIIGYDKDNQKIYPMHDPATKDGDYYKDSTSNIIGITRRRGGYYLRRVIYLRREENE